MSQVLPPDASGRFECVGIPGRHATSRIVIPPVDDPSTMHVIVHGGAGGEPDEPEPRQAVLDEAAENGAAAETPLDAVEAAIHVLESSPRFNAGVGGAVQSDGEIRTDAGVMTSDLDAGAACSMPGVEHAVSAARVVMEETPHVLVSGRHAVELAGDFGVEVDRDLWSDRTRDRWGDEDVPAGPPGEHLSWLSERFGRTDPGGRETDEGDGATATDEHDHDTVGAVARDGDEFAAATSTGGRWLALAGRGKVRPSRRCRARGGRPTGGDRPGGPRDSRRERRRTRPPAGG